MKKKVLSFVLAFTLVLSLVGINTNVVLAADSSTMGTNNYTTGVSGGATLTAGQTYSFGGYNWVAAEVNNTAQTAVLQSTGVTSGAWPGYAMSKFGGSANSYYSSNIDGQDISGYNSTMTNLYNSIKAAENTNASYGSGLFLVSNAKAGTTTNGNKGSGNYCSALTTAATNYSSFGATGNASWLGTVGGVAWCVDSDGGVSYNVNYFQSNSFVVAPAFNLDLSKVKLSGSTLTVATFSDSTGINATQSINSVYAGDTVDLASVITGVTYVGGDNNGRTGSYKVSVNEGTVSGTTWTAPTNISTPTNVTLTITEQGSGLNLSTTKTITVNPRFTYNLNGGTVDGTNPYTYTGTEITLINPTKDGYDFVGWTYTGQTTPQMTVVIPASGNDTNTYTANWTPIVYTIEYDYQGGTASNVGTYTIESAPISLNAPEKSGFTFDGWTGSNGNTPQATVTIPTGSTGNKSYTANWTIESFPITYTLNGGTETTNPANYNVETDTFTLNAPTKTGYTFLGWTSVSDNISQAQTVITIEKGSTGAKDFTANWQVNTYNVTLNDNNGTGGQGSVVATYDAMTPSVAVPTRTGYTFQGYYSGDTKYINADGTGAINWNIASDTTLTAKWEANQYTVTLNDNGGSGGSGNITATYDSLINGVNVPTKTGYEFLGYFDNNNKKYVNENGQGVAVWDKDQNYELYAHWNIITYHITYEYAGGSATNPTTYTVEDEFTVINPTKFGYNFTAWSGDKTGDTVTFSHETGDKTLTANYSPKTSVITFNKGAGTGGTNSQNATYDAALSDIIVPTRDGYDFIGYEDSNGKKYFNRFGNPVVDAWDKDCDTELSAIWDLHGYNIDYDYQGGTVATANAERYYDTTPAFTITNPTKYGYNFAGWTVNGSATPVMTFTVEAHANTDYTLVANWTPVASEVTFNKNGGTNGDDGVTAYYNAALTSVNIPTKTAYDFTGYYDQGVKYFDENGNGVIPWDKIVDTELIAGWTAHNYDITYNLSGGTLVGQKDTYTVEDNSFILVNPTKNGKAFIGWTYQGQDEPEMITTVVGGTYGDLEFTANYVNGTNKISFDAGNGTNVSDLDVAEGYPISNVAVPTKPGYKFLGYFDENGNQIFDENGIGLISEWGDSNATVTARWHEVTNTITFDKNGGSGGTDSIVVDYNTYLPNITVPTRSGYTFKGYYNGNTQYYNENGVSTILWQENDMTLLAKWEQNSNGGGGSWNWPTPKPDPDPEPTPLGDMTKVQQTVLVTDSPITVTDSSLTRITPMETGECGVHFKGYADENGNLYTDSNGNVIKTIEQNQTLYPVYDVSRIDINNINLDVGKRPTVTSHEKDGSVSFAITTNIPKVYVASAKILEESFVQLDNNSDIKLSNGEPENYARLTLKVPYEDYVNDGLNFNENTVVGLKGAEIIWQEKPETYSDEITIIAKYQGVMDLTMYRLYNPNNGDHIYLDSINERDYLSSIGWNYEGVNFMATTDGHPIYRFYNPNSGEHFFTSDKVERDALISWGWNYEGVGFYSDGSGAPVYRLYNPYNNGGAGAHHFTADQYERDVLVGYGWVYEGVAWLL